ncbi:putative MFS family arabinose efflux permease [Variovorax boronicumulans]|uniref:MFS transporter n=1 Tax=Variovorax boronicumulans TaxID=436515 RepID=UPI0027860259|nr:MFS transporter [Variovorax boronicumulans]MDP9990064.1 putative MFS family arabinose efflux permease [Variovorax boronicumulans]MDQ0001428.1 putative MFS family arabinose efflux permease [Variovorax boronicumulans]
MSSSSNASHPPAAGLTPALTFVFAVACGLCVANIYYAQPLIGPISDALELHAGLAGLIMTLTQLGYGAGLLLLVPLADVVENRRLIVGALFGAVIGLAGIALSNSAVTFLAASFMVGACAVAAQVLLPFASHLAPEATRGKVVGNIMAGLLGGIMLSRPFASMVAASLGWRALFWISAVLMAMLIAVLWRVLPERRPHASIGYARTMASLPGIVWNTPLLRRRGWYQGMMFAAFQAFWTAVPLALVHEFGMGQRGIGLFALAGAAGALLAPVAGRLADRGLTRPATGAAIVVALLSFVLGAVSMHFHSLAGLVAAGILLDGAVQLCQVLNFRSLFMLAPELRGRLNGLFMTFIFICAAVASGIAAAVYAFHGWTGLCLLGGGFVSLALLLYLTEFRRQPVAVAASIR